MTSIAFPPNASIPMADGPRLQITGLLRVALLATAALATALGGAAFLPIDGAVIAQGRLVVAGKPEQVQSLVPGLVANLAIAEGDHVEVGQVLMTLDPAEPQGQLQIAEEKLAAALAEQARLLAEAGGQDRPQFTAPALPFPAPDLRPSAARQELLFEARLRQRSEARAQLHETETQISAQIAGLRAQDSAARAQQQLLREDIARQATLVDEGLARAAPLNELRRQDATLSGQIASFATEITRLDASRREAGLKLAQDENRRNEEVAQGLRDAGNAVRELTAQILSLRSVLARSTLRAPVTGIVQELTVPAPGSVINAGVTLAQIVPSDRALEIEVLVDPRNIDSVHQGEKAEVMLTALDPRAVPRLPARVLRVPPGVVTAPESGQSFYRVALALEPGALPPEVSLRAGMPVQAFISTGERSLARWLLSPLAGPIAQVMRER